jgi:hypothetical protein
MRLNLRPDCLVKHVVEGKMERNIEVTERRGGRHKQVLEYLKETRRYLKLKAEALCRTVWRTHFALRLWASRMTEWVKNLPHSRKFISLCLVKSQCYHHHGNYRHQIQVYETYLCIQAS